MKSNKTASPRENANKLILGFQTYKLKYGDCNVPVKFKIPNDDESWPQEIHGMLLGRSLDNIRNKHNLHLKIRGDLINLGVDLSPRMMKLNFDQLFNVLRVYKLVHSEYFEKFGRLVVKSNFVVPYSEPYPGYSWGYGLGNTVQKIRLEKVFVKHRAEWEELGLDFEVRNKINNSFETILEALVAYKKIHGNVNMTTMFVVPSTVEYPAQTHGIKLGARVYSMRKRGAFAEYKDKLLELGVLLPA